VKNLTFEQNIQQIVENNLSIVRTSIEVTMGTRPEDIVLQQQQLITLFTDVWNRVMGGQDGVRLYGLIMPVGIAVSDYGDHRINIFTEDKQFNTLESIRNYLVNELVSGHEVYVYSVNVVKIVDPFSFDLQTKYYIRCKSIHRSRWDELTTEAENTPITRELYDRSPWNHQPNTVEKVVSLLEPLQQIKEHKF